MTKAKSKTGIPSTEHLVSETIERIKKDKPGSLDAANVEKKFSDVTEMVFYSTYDTYKKYESDAFRKSREKVLESSSKQSFTRGDVEKMLKENSETAITMEKSMSQSRKTRAGLTFEVITKLLFQTLDIPCEKITTADKARGLKLIDIVVPDRETARSKPDKATFLSLKTTLKDRWKLTQVDQMQGQRTYLVTILQRDKNGRNENIATSKVEEINRGGVIIYLPDYIKDEKFSTIDGVRKLSELPADLR